MGYVSLRSETYVSLGMVMPRSSPDWTGFTAFMTTIPLVITVRTIIYHVQYQHAIICLSCIILVRARFYGPF